MIYSNEHPTEVGFYLFKSFPDAKPFPLEIYETNGKLCVMVGQDFAGPLSDFPNNDFWCRLRPATPWEKAPYASGVWWWWNEDEDSAPIPVNIAYSGTDDSYFAETGQYGWTRTQPVKEMGGLWMRIWQPDLPSEEEFQRIKRL